MFRPPYLARVAAGAAVYALEETRRLPATAAQFPITAISHLLQTTMHVQQFMTSLALKGDTVFDRLTGTTAQPEWATFDEDESDDEPVNWTGENGAVFGWTSDTKGEVIGFTLNDSREDPIATQMPEVAARYDYPAMSLAQLRARLRMLTVEELVVLLAYEKATTARPPFITMLTNRIATVQAQ